MKYDPSKRKSENVLNFKIKSVIAIVNGIIYYEDKDYNICLFDLKTKHKEKLTEKLDAVPYTVTQFHNYLIFVGMGNETSGLVCFDIIAKKRFFLKCFPAEVYPADDCLYMQDGNDVIKLTINDGKAVFKSYGALLAEQYNFQN